MNCSNSAAGLLKALCAAFVILLFTHACTEVDDRLGSSLVPTHQTMQSRVKRLQGVKTYLYREDSLPATNLGVVYFGREQDLMFGKRTNGFVVQFRPAAIPYVDDDNIAGSFGLNPIVDSMLLYLPLYDVSGDTTQVQDFEVWEIKGGPDYLYGDSTYYTSFPAEDYSGDLLFTFTHTGKRDVYTKLEPTTAGWNYMYSLTAFDYADEAKYTDSLFHIAYNGLYIKPAAGSPFSATYAADLSYSILYLCTRSHDPVDVSAILDTLATPMIMYNTTGYNNLSINTVSYDYTGSELETLETSTRSFTDTLPDSPTQKLMYVQPMGGVTGYLRFTDELIAELKSLRTEIVDGVEIEYPDMMINQAEMYIYLTDGSTPVLNTSMPRLGSYLDLKKLTGIPDYLYYDEWYQQQQQLQQQQPATYQLPYNGFLNRSSGRYILDITSYIQQLVKGEAGEPLSIPPVFHIGPQAYGFFSFGQSVLKGYGSDTPIEIRLTYTLIDGEDADE